MYIALALMALSLAAEPAHAQDKPLHIVLGFPAGASSDTVSRLIADKMRVSLGRPVVVDNKPGAGGIVANMAVKSAPADGSIFLMTPLAAMVAYPHSYTKLDYDPFKDYVPVAHVAAFAHCPRHQRRSAGQDRGRIRGAGQDRRITLISPLRAPAVLPHFFGILFARNAGLELTHVPYKGTAPVLQALYAGEIPAAFLPIADLGTLTQSGKGRLLATAGTIRSPQYPDTPTFKESGYNIEGSAWYAMFAPAGTPKSIVDPVARAAIDAVHALMSSSAWSRWALKLPASGRPSSRRF